MDSQNTPEENTNNTDNVTPNTTTEQDQTSVQDPVESSSTPEPSETVTTTREPVAPAVLPPALVATAKPKSKFKPVLLVMLILALLGGGGFAAYNFLKKSPEKTVSAGKGSAEIAELRIGTTYPPFNKVYPDPNFVLAGNWAVTTQLYEGLVGFKNGDSYEPLLAKSWTNPNSKTWIFTLKDNVKFHNGKILTATDVKTSIDKAVADPNTFSLLIESIDKVTVKDATHLEITTKEPDAILINKLAFLYVQGEEKLNGQPVGTGAYRVADGFDGAAAEKEMRLVAFDDYHLAKTAVRKVTYIGYDDNDQMVAALKDKKIDMSDFVGEGTTPGDIPGYTKLNQSDGFIFYLGVNVNDKKSPLSKLAVRQALRLSIDLDEYIKNVGLAGDPASQITAEANFGFDPELKPAKKDVAKAKQLLKDAGYANGVSIKLSFDEKDSNRKQFEEIKRQAADSGISLVATPAADFDEHNTNIAEGKTQLYKVGSSSAFIDSYDLFAFNFKSLNFDDAKLNDLLAKSNAEFNATERKKLLQEASRYIVEQGAAIPLYTSKGTYYVAENLDYKQALGFSLPGDYVRNISAK